MKTVLMLIVAGLASGCPDRGCDCTIVPFKSDNCLKQCVPKIVAEASYSELTEKYRLPQDTASKIITARERGTHLDASTISTVNAILRQKQRPMHNAPNR
jgi:hypothetical protein